MIRRIAPAILAVIALAAFAPAQAEHTPDCNLRGATFAKWIQPEGGQASVTTQAGVVAYTVPGAPTAPSVSLSTTGNIEVKAEHACVKVLRVTVFKDGNPTAIYDQASEKGCGHAVHTAMVPIGLDGGSYQFQLSGFSCNGQPLKFDDRGGFVGDPPLPL